MFPTKVLSEMCMDHDGRGSASEAQGGAVIPTKVLFQCSGATVFPGGDGEPDEGTIPVQLSDGDPDEGGRVSASEAQGGAMI